MKQIAFDNKGKDLNEVTVNILCKLYLDDFTF